MYKQLTIIHPKIEGSKEYTFGYKLWVIKITLQDINQILYPVPFFKVIILRNKYCFYLNRIIDY